MYGSIAWGAQVHRSFLLQKKALGYLVTVNIMLIPIQFLFTLGFLNISDLFKMCIKTFFSTVLISSLVFRLRSEMIFSKYYC